MEILIVAIAFILGILAGWRLTWWRMERVWKDSPEKFKTIVDGVIALRGASKNKGT